MMFILSVAAAICLASANPDAELSTQLEADLRSPTLGLEAKFTSYKTLYNKEYDDHSHEASAFSAFSLNDAVIRRSNAKELSYTLGHNVFSDLTHEQFRERMLGGFLEEKKTHRNEDTTLDASSAPDSIDWVAKGAVTPVKNQNQCGGCWAFSATGAMEGAYFIANQSLISLSEQELVSCDTAVHGCGGGLMDYAFQFVEQNGLCTEQAYPYVSGDTGNSGVCRSQCQSVVSVEGFKDVPAGDENALKAAVAQQPVSVAIEADSQVFQLYSGGVLTDPGCGQNLDHGVLTVGYGTDNGQDYWKIKNSWGPSWGEGGFIRIERGVNMCGISKCASFPTGVKASGTPPAPTPTPTPHPHPHPKPDCKDFADDCTTADCAEYSDICQRTCNACGGPPTPTPKPGCKDIIPDCDASVDCPINESICQLTCNACGKPMPGPNDCRDIIPDCDATKDCPLNESICKLTCGLCPPADALVEPVVVAE